LSERPKIHIQGLVSPNPPRRQERTLDPLRVAVLSDDALLRAALASLIEQNGVDITPAASAQVALFDPGADETKVPAKLVALDDISIPVLVLVPDAAMARLALEAGAAGVVLRDRVGTHLVSALDAVRAGLRVLDIALGDELLPHRTSAGPNAPLVPLTAREEEVVGLLAQGLSNRQIARRLGISEHTAKFHIGRILDKLDAGTRTEAVVRALRHGMLML
jgi:DNA-binding NarL/FixJ family response regulator